MYTSDSGTSHSPPAGFEAGLDSSRPTRWSPSRSIAQKFASAKEMGDSHIPCRLRPQYGYRPKRWALPCRADDSRYFIAPAEAVPPESAPAGSNGKSGCRQRT